MAALPLTVRKNIKEFEGARDTHLATIKAATGRDFTVEVDWPSWVDACKAKDRENAGEIVYSWYLEAIAYNVKKVLADDMSKEAFNEAVKNTAIKLELGGSSGYGAASIKGGQLVIAVPKDNVASNIGECGNNIESLL